MWPRNNEKGMSLETQHFLLISKLDLMAAARAVGLMSEHEMGGGCLGMPTKMPFFSENKISLFSRLCLK